jgi:hypothetical protein
MNYSIKKTSVTEQSIKNLESFTLSTSITSYQEYTQRSTIQPKPKLKDEGWLLMHNIVIKGTKQWRQSIHSRTDSEKLLKRTQAQRRCYNQSKRTLH